MSVLRCCAVSSCELSIHRNHKPVKAQNILLDAFYDVQLQVISRCLHSSVDQSNPSKVHSDPFTYGRSSAVVVCLCT